AIARLRADGTATPTRLAADRGACPHASSTRLSHRRSLAGRAPVLRGRARRRAALFHRRVASRSALTLAPALAGTAPGARPVPRLALDGGQDGLQTVRRILLDAATFLRPRGLLLVEIGHNRHRLERAFPRLPFIWPETSAGYDCVFLLSREDLPGSALQ